MYAAQASGTHLDYLISDEILLPAMSIVGNCHSPAVNAANQPVLLSVSDGDFSPGGGRLRYVWHRFCQKLLASRLFFHQLRSTPRTM